MYVGTYGRNNGHTYARTYVRRYLQRYIIIEFMLASREFAASVSPSYPELVEGLLTMAADPNIVKGPFVSKKGPQPARTFFHSRFL